ncbi:MAG TPA: hypothetical protein PLX15_04745 [Candidatus Woesearchaeota archaeon]|nr:hypothetical protein [Candidatus Woesearchaeota archaeon]
MGTRLPDPTKAYQTIVELLYAVDKEIDCNGDYNGIDPREITKIQGQFFRFPDGMDFGRIEIHIKDGVVGKYEINYETAFPKSPQTSNTTGLESRIQSTYPKNPEVPLKQTVQVLCTLREFIESVRGKSQRYINPCQTGNVAPHGYQSPETSLPPIGIEIVDRNGRPFNLNP